MALIAVPLIAWWKFGMNAILAFWFAYVVTRPLGASFADYLGKPKSIGGVGFGDGTVAAAASVVIILLVAYAMISRSDVQRPAEAERPGAAAGDDDTARLLSANLPRD